MARPDAGAPLTPREEEIAGLVAQALTSAQIAKRLFISVRTVHAHLHSIYAKTGTGSRTRLTVWLLAGRGTLPAPPAPDSGGEP